MHRAADSLPGGLPRHGCDELNSTMDLLPTLARMCGGKVPDDRVLAWLMDRRSFGPESVTSMTLPACVEPD
jgi:hypothetical protein